MTSPSLVTNATSSTPASSSMAWAFLILSPDPHHSSRSAATGKSSGVEEVKLGRTERRFSDQLTTSPLIRSLSAIISRAFGSDLIGLVEGVVDGRVVDAVPFFRT